ncbi:Bug family tripartite tricarboxylate transporter substrate binding protein [Muricoccus radiodurans]|uniref:Bug family tripartite tricarboxylate transporter substrate binding protein n=1 Tax=Muricoccus radiodurans TaxID=2231721 RepID=UPI003CF19526
MQRREVLLGATTLLGAGALAHAATAQGWPGRPVRLIIPFPPGGITDISGRLIARHMSATLGQPVVVENRPGGNTVIAAELTARAPKDGHTLIIAGTTTLAINPALRERSPYQPTDFDPVAPLYEAPWTLTVRDRMPVRTVDEFLHYARERQGQLRYCTNGEGSSSHLFGKMFEAATGVQMIDVAYQGTAPAVTDILAGNLDVIFESPIAMLAHIRAGSLRTLAVSSAQRVEVLPDAPTFRELGLPSLEITFWSALFAPAGTPAEVIGILNRAANLAMQDQDIQRRLAADAVTVQLGEPEVLAGLVRRDARIWGDVIRSLNLRMG